jgi:hypothetical protein
MDNKKKALKARNDYLLGIESANASINRYFADDCSDLMDVSKNIKTYDTPALRQTGSRNLMGPKTLPTIWGTYMKLVTKYQISAINSC